MFALTFPSQKGFSHKKSIRIFFKKMKDQPLILPQLTIKTYLEDYEGKRIETVLIRNSSANISFWPVYSLNLD